MKIMLKISDSMDKDAGHPSSLERRFVRMPEKLREACQLDIGDFVNMRSKTGEIITLQVIIAYKEDVDADPLSAYVTSEIFNILKLVDIKAYEQDIEPVEGITLGCDPEFFLIDVFTGQKEWPAKVFKKYGQVGYDGPMMEIRPLPSQDESVVVNNMWGLIKRTRQGLDNSKKIDSKRLRMVGTSCVGGTTAGFHLHFGIPTRMLGQKADKQAVARQMTKALSYYVGIPSMIIEGRNDYVRRCAANVAYGKPMDFRLDNKTLEYRVLGGHNMRHPVLSKGVLALGAVIMEDMVSRIKVCTDSFVNLKSMSSHEDLVAIYPHALHWFDLTRVICVREIDVAIKHMDIIINDVRSMVGFGKRAGAIEDYFRCAVEGIEFNNDIEINWGGSYERQQGKMDFYQA